MKDPRHKRILQNELTLLNANVDQISTQLAFKKTLNNRAVWLQRLKEEYLTAYIKVYDQKMENGLAIRMVTKVRLEAERVFFLLRAVRVQLTGSESDLKELFQEPTLDYELEEKLTLMYNIFEDSEVEWNEIYDQFDAKRLLNKLVFAQPDRFADPRMSSLLRFEFQAISEQNVTFRKLVNVLFNLIVLTDKHYTLYTEVEKMGKKMSELQRKQTQLEKEEIDLRLKISNISHLIETMEVKSQLIEEEIEAVDSEMELKNHMLTTLLETGEVDGGLLPQETFGGLNVTPKELEKYALGSIPESIKAHLEFKGEGGATEEDVFTLSDHIAGFKKGLTGKEGVDGMMEEVVGAVGGKLQTFGRQRSGMDEGQWTDKPIQIADELVSPIEDDHEKDQMRHKLVMDCAIESNFENNSELKMNNYRSDRPSETHERMSLSRTSPSNNTSRLGKWVSFNTNSKAKEDMSATGQEFKRRKTGQTTKLLDVFSFLRKKYLKNNLLLKSLYAKQGSDCLTTDLLIDTYGMGRNVKGSTLQPIPTKSVPFNFDTFQNINNNLKTISTSHRDVNQNEVSLDEVGEGGESPEFPQETSGDDLQGFDYLKSSFHQKNVNYNDFQIMTNSAIFPDSKSPNNNSSIVHDEFLREIDDEIKKYETAEIMKSSYFRDKDSDNSSPTSGRVLAGDLTKYKKSPFAGATSRFGQVATSNDAFVPSATSSVSEVGVSPVLGRKRFQPFETKVEDDKSAFETMDFNRKERNGSPVNTTSVNQEGFEKIKKMIDTSFDMASPNQSEGKKHGRSVDHRFTGKDHLGEPLGSSKTVSRRKLARILSESQFTVFVHLKGSGGGEGEGLGFGRELVIEDVAKVDFGGLRTPRLTKTTQVSARNVVVSTLPCLIYQACQPGHRVEGGKEDLAMEDMKGIVNWKGSKEKGIQKAVQTDQTTVHLFNSFTEPRTTASGAQTPPKHRTDLKLDSLGQEVSANRNVYGRDCRFGSLTTREDHWRRSAFDSNGQPSSGSLPRQVDRSTYRGVIFENVIPQQGKMTKGSRTPSFGPPSLTSTYVTTPTTTPKTSQGNLGSTKLSFGWPSEDMFNTLSGATVLAKSPNVLSPVKTDPTGKGLNQSTFNLIV